MEEFDTGDVVYLNGDVNLQLTVEGTNPSGEIMVVWFDQDDELRRTSFNPQMLHK